MSLQIKSCSIRIKDLSVFCLLFFVLSLCPAAEPLLHYDFTSSAIRQGGICAEPELPAGIRAVKPPALVLTGEKDKFKFTIPGSEKLTLVNGGTLYALVRFDKDGDSKNTHDMIFFKPNEFLLGRHLGGLYFNGGGDKFVMDTISKSIPLKRWITAAASVSRIKTGYVVRLYINGKNVESKWFPIEMKTVNKPVTVGEGWGGPWYMCGQIGRLMFFDKALTDQEIAELTRKEKYLTEGAPQGEKIEEIDRNFAVSADNHDGMDWYSVDSKGFELTGFYWRKPGERFRRIPFDVTISKGVDQLAWHTAGGMLRFRTDAPEIRVSAQVGGWIMPHMTTLGARGFDIYTGVGRDKIYARTVSINPSKAEYTVPVYGPVGTRRMREFTLHFPLYAGVKKIQIGLTQGAKVEPPTPWPDPRPIVVYGTSIQQGGCASRPGMCHTNIMSRMLNRPFINLAFSGNGMGEPEMAKLMAEIKDPAMFILDYDANAHVEGLKKTLSGFIDILREKHPTTPILLVSELPQRNEFGEEPEFNEKRLALTEIHLQELRKRRNAGDRNIHFLDGTTLFGDAPWDCTVDGVHATDLGFYMIAKRMAPVIERILSSAQK